MKSQICQNLTVLLNPSNICRNQQNYRRKDCGSFSPFMSQTRSKFRFKSCNIFWLKVKANWASAVFLLILFQSGWTQNFTGSKLKQLQQNTQYTSPGLTHLVHVYVTNETSKWYNVSSSSSLNISIARLSPNKVSSVLNFNFILTCSTFIENFVMFQGLAGNTLCIIRRIAFDQIYSVSILWYIGGAEVSALSTYK